MATATESKPRKRTKKAEPPATTSLTIVIQGTAYAVSRVRVEDRGFGITRAYRLRKTADNTVYDCARTIDGHACDCGDFEFRHAGQGTLCKHLRSLRAWGLID